MGNSTVLRCRLLLSRGSVTSRVLLVWGIHYDLQPCSHSAVEWQKRWRKKGHAPPFKVITWRLQTSLPVPLAILLPIGQNLVTWPQLADRMLGNVVLLWTSGRMVLGNCTSLDHCLDLGAVAYSLRDRLYHGCSFDLAFWWQYNGVIKAISFGRRWIWVQIWAPVMKTF